MCAIDEISEIDCLQQKNQTVLDLVYCHTIFNFCKNNKIADIFRNEKKMCFFTIFCNKKKQLKSKFKKVLDMRYSYSCKEYVAKCHKDRSISFGDFIKKSSKNVMELKPKQSKMYWKIALIEWGTVWPSVAVIWMMLCFILKWKGSIFLIKPYL